MDNQLETLRYELSALRLEVSELKILLQGKQPESNVKNESIDTKISNFLLSLGIPANIKGFLYLREAIKMTYRNFDAVEGITKNIYPAIAAKFQTTQSRVERAMRHAIESSWKRNRQHEFYRNYFHTKPTNGHFVAMVADQFLLEAAAG